MLGFDIARQPHPKALAILSPLVSGGVFFVGLAYFRLEATTKIVADPKLDRVLIVAVAIILSYAAGLLLSVVIATPYISLLYFAGFVTGGVIVYVKRRRSNSPTEPSKQPSLRRAATVVLGPSLAPRTPEQNATDLPDRIIEAIGSALGISIPAGEVPGFDEIRKTIRAEGLKAFTAEYEEQWNQIHRALYQVELRRRNPLEDLVMAVEPALSIAAGILVWRWLSFPAGPQLQLAAIATFMVIGAILFMQGLAKAPDYTDAISMQAFLFEEILDRSRAEKP